MRTGVKTRLCVVALICLSALAYDITWAAEMTGSVDVTVVNAQSRKPLIFTKVEIYGARNLQGLTGNDGRVPFEELPPGTYQLEVSKQKYKNVTINNVIVTAGKATMTTVALELAPPPKNAGLREVGRVSTRNPLVKTSTTQANSETLEAKLSHSMVDALKSLPSVSVSTSGFAQYPSIGGHPANQTAVSIEGVPVSAFGAIPNLQGFNLDLFSAVSIDTSSANGAAGTINFETRNPSLDWLGTASHILGPFSKDGLTLTEGGSVGRFGFSYTHASRDEGNALDGQRFLDTSGLDYLHNTLSRASGDAFKARYPFSMNNVLFASLVSIKSNAPLFCTTFTGPLPCGYGPLNDDRSKLTSGLLRDIVSIGRLGATLTLFHNNSSEVLDQSGRYVSGVHLPQVSNSKMLADGFIVDGTYQIGRPGRGYPINFNLTSTHQTTSSLGNGFGRIVPAPIASLGFTSGSLSGTLLSKRHFSSNLRFGLQKQDTHAQVNGEISLGYSPTSYDSFRLQYGTGFFASPSAAFSGIADPPSLQINCGAHNAVGFGPSIPNNDTSSATTSLAWTHTGSRISTSLSLHHEVQRNAPLFAYVGAAAFDPALFAPAYMTGVQQNFAANCGTTAPPLTTKDLFYGVSAAVGRATYDGGEMSADIPLGHNVIADISYGLQFARAYGSGGAFFSSASTVRSGAQLPNVPMHIANLALRAAVAKPRLAWSTDALSTDANPTDARPIAALANMHYVSVNNPNNLPAYLTVDAGVEVPLKHAGTLTVSLLNLTNTHGGTFASATGAVPLATQSGRFGTIATPLAPHSLNVGITLPIGQEPYSDNASSNCGAGCIGWTADDLPATPPKDPLAFNRATGMCGPELVSAAKHYQEVIRGYIAGIERARARDGRYPANFQSAEVDGMRLYYRPNGDSYAVLIGAPTHSWHESIRFIKPFMGCSKLHMADLKETRAHHLYVSPHNEQKDVSPIADYAPEVGLYIAPSLIENASEFSSPKLLPVPATAPSEPFALNTSAECTASNRPATIAVLALLKDYVTAFYDKRATPEAPEAFKISQHTGAGGTWLEFKFQDWDLLQTTIPCLRITGTNDAALKKLGLGAARDSGTLNFAPRLGLYQMSWE